ncbi:FtsX-like permease family protein [Streptomyces sp. NPDC057257]|uniref:FtsX-like permease family protein n=1 Tax=Streptomyces sp. NPDC057257 TaxID=3346071 RepID=UPI00363117EE
MASQPTRTVTDWDSVSAHEEPLPPPDLPPWGVGLLGAFLVMERRREYAVLRTVDADTGRVLTGPAVESAVAVVGSLLIGIPLGLGLGVLSIRVLSLFLHFPHPRSPSPAVCIEVTALLPEP